MLKSFTISFLHVVTTGETCSLKEMSVIICSCEYDKHYQKGIKQIY